MTVDLEPVGEDLRSVIEDSLKLARSLGNSEVEDMLLMALLSLGPRDFDGGKADNGEPLHHSLATLLRAMATN